jgi:transposase
VLPEIVIRPSIGSSHVPGTNEYASQPPSSGNAVGRTDTLRGVVVGRKDHYGSRSQRGTEVAALFYSLIESAKLAGVGPHTYMRVATLAALRRADILLPHQLA